jgi:hypothetical protein
MTAVARAHPSIRYVVSLDAKCVDITLVEAEREGSWRHTGTRSCREGGK